MKELKITLNSQNEWIEKVLKETKNADDYLAALIEMDQRINGTDQIFYTYEREEYFKHLMSQASEEERKEKIETTLNEAYDLVKEIYECVPESSKLEFYGPEECVRNIPEDDLIATLVMDIERLKALFELSKNKGE